MTRTHVRRRRMGSLALFTILVVVVVGGAGDALGNAKTRPEPGRSREYVVAPGDTLWSIADHLGGDQDLRSVIDAIERANGIEAGDLTPGQLIVVPTA